MESITDRVVRLEKIAIDAPEAPALIEEITAEIFPVDSRDVPDEDGVTPRDRWVELCVKVAERDGITPDEANDRLLQMPEFGGPRQ